MRDNGKHLFDYIGTVKTQVQELQVSTFKSNNYE
jgi:hypothetical protein